MNRQDARRIAETITNEQLLQMFKSAKENIKNWNCPSIVNKGMTKGTAWNVLAKNFDVTHDHHILAKTNMVREFGEFLPDKLKVKKHKPSRSVEPIHQEPNFDNY